jgi:hypothetical protein
MADPKPVGIYQKVYVESHSEDEKPAVKASNNS